MSAFRVALVALSAAAVTAACAAGQNAQTANDKPSLDGTQGKVGSIQLEGVALHAPGSLAYPSGADVPLAVYIANSGHSADALTNVSSPAFAGGWAIVDTSTLTGSPGPTSTAAPGAVPGTESATGSSLAPSAVGASASASAAASAGSAASAAPSAGAPQQVAGGAALGLGLQDLTANGTGSSRTLVLRGLVGTSSPLYPGTAVKVTFTFAKAGSTTLTVPVQISAEPNTATLPGGGASAP